MERRFLGKTEDHTMKNFIITIDYELFGDGSGNVFTDVIEPTDRIMEIAGRYGARLTFFYEWMEFYRIQEEWDRGNCMGYEQNPVAAAKEQMLRALQAGHDVQLHIHPQWQKAVFQDGEWQIDESNFRLADFNPLPGKGCSWMLKTAKEELETLLRPADSAYRCRALRAGWYNAIPSEPIVDAMRENGFDVESSVYTGGYENARNYYDYSMITNEKGWWHIDRDIRYPIGENRGIQELPIMALPMLKIFKYFRWKKILYALFNPRKTNATLNNKLDRRKTASVGSRISFFRGKEAQTWDFCVVTNRLQKKFLHEAEKFYRETGRDTFTISGHSKIFHNNPRGLEFLLKQIHNDSASRCLTISEWEQNIVSKES